MIFLVRLFKRVTTRKRNSFVLLKIIQESQAFSLAFLFFLVLNQGVFLDACLAIGQSVLAYKKKFGIWI